MSKIVTIDEFWDGVSFYTSTHHDGVEVEWNGEVYIAAAVFDFPDDGVMRVAVELTPAKEAVAS